MSVKKAQAAWRVGDVVQLKSGGPLMTVAYTPRIDMVGCKWFAGYEVHYGEFSPASLKKVVP